MSGRELATPDAPAAEAAFSETVRTIYEAALDPEAWPAALSRIGALFDGPGAVILFYRDNSPAEFIHAPGVRGAVEVYLAEEWWRRDLHAQRAIEKHLTVGDVFSDESVATPAEIASHPIYTEFFHRVGFGWLMSCVLLPERGALVCLSVPRARERGPFAAAEIGRLALIGRHAEQALRLSLRIGALETSERALDAALDALDIGILALSAEGGLVMSNRLGAEEFDDCFAVVDGKVTARLPEEAARLAALLVAALGATAGAEEAGAVPRPCLMTGRDGSARAVWALPLGETAGRRIAAGDPARVLLLSRRLESDLRVDPTVIRDLFRLSLGEARVAALVGTGATVRDAAEALGIAEGTARLVLKHVFRKLGISRQAELALRIAALGGIAAPKPRPEPRGPGGLRRGRGAPGSPDDIGE